MSKQEDKRLAMKHTKSAKDLLAENEDLRYRLEEALDTLRAIGSGELGSLEKVTGSSIYQYFSSTDLQLFEVLLEQGLKGNSTGELALQAGGENCVPVLLSLSPLQRTDIPGPGGAVMVDITERKKMEEALKISETRYRRLF